MYLNIFPQNIYRLESLDKEDVVYIVTDAPFQKVLEILNKIVHDNGELNEQKLQKKIEKANYHLDYLDLDMSKLTPLVKIKNAQIDIDFKLKRSQIEEI